jgi:hypothetical protein
VDNVPGAGIAASRSANAAACCTEKEKGGQVVLAAFIENASNYLRWLLTSLVISNIETCFLPPKMERSLASALIMRLLSLS